MATDPDVEALRQRLYRPGASEQDLATYLHAADLDRRPEADAEDAAAPRAIRRGPSLRPFVVGGVGVLAAAALGGALLLGNPATPTPISTPTPTRASAIATGGADGVWFVSTGGEPVLDGGERDHARGVSVAEGPAMVRYTVAAGDTVDAVASRFTLCQGDVLLALPYGIDPAALPADQTLELSRSSTHSPPGC